MVLSSAIGGRQAMKQISLLCLFAGYLLFLCAGCVHFEARFPLPWHYDRFSAGPMIQLDDANGQTAVTIAWRTEKETDSKVEYALPQEKNNIVQSNEKTRRHTVVLKNLLPSTCYPYRAQSRGSEIGQDRFCTFKNEHEPFTFVIFGDSGYGRRVQYTMAKQIEEQTPDFILHTGDLIYPYGEEWGYRLFFYNPYKNLIARVFFFPSMGNHDARTKNGKPLLNNFRLPKNRPYYSFIYANTLVIALDSTRTHDRMQAKWLEENLRRGSQNKRIVWKIVFFHHPPFTNHRRYDGDRAVRAAWVPIFEKYGVDIVFSGHNHLYARFHPQNSIVYIIEGVGGRAHHRGKKDDPRVAYTYGDAYGFGVARINGNTLTFSHITHKGNIVDSFEMRK